MKSRRIGSRCTIRNTIRNVHYIYVTYIHILEGDSEGGRKEGGGEGGRKE